MIASIVIDLKTQKNNSIYIFQRLPLIYSQPYRWTTCKKRTVSIYFRDPQESSVLNEWQISATNLVSAMTDAERERVS